MKKALSRKNLWEMAPQPIKTAVGSMLGLVGIERLFGSLYREQRRLLRAADRWTAEQAKQFQTEKLREVCRLAAGTPFYRKAFADAGFDPAVIAKPSDIQRLPFIDKDVLRSNLHDMCAVPPTTRGVDYVSTGGSSGQPLRFYIGAERSQIEYAHLVTSWERCGFDLRTTQAVCRGQVFPPNSSGFRHQYDPLLRKHYYSNFHMSEAAMAAYLDHVATIGPCFLKAYPSAAAIMAAFIRRTGRAAPTNIRGILAESENVYPEDREMCEQVFGVRYFSCYGHSEKLVLGVECEHSSDYHIWPTYGYCELIRTDGKVINSPGERGEIVGTGFINRVVPFIRYRTGDYAEYVGGQCCKCGREQMILRNIEGRGSRGSLVGEDGQFISNTAINVHDDTFEGVVEYQFAQSQPGVAEMRVVPCRPLTEEDRNRILTRMNARLQGQVRLTLSVCDAVQQTERGKKPRIIQTIGAA